MATFSLAPSCSLLSLPFHEPQGHVGGGRNVLFGDVDGGVRKLGHGGGTQRDCARAARDDEAMSHLAMAMGVSRLATISGPAAQEEARVRVLRRAQLLAALKEKTTGIPEASLLWAEFDAIEQVSITLLLAPRSSWAWSRS